MTKTVTLRNARTIKDLKKVAFKINGFIELKSDFVHNMWIYRVPTYDENGECITNDKFCCSENGVTCFRDETSTIYVVPTISRIRKLLKAAGFAEKAGYVPFAHGVIPADYNQFSEWNNLVNQAEEIHKEGERKSSRKRERVIA